MKERHQGPLFLENQGSMEIFLRQSTGAAATIAVDERTQWLTPSYRRLLVRGELTERVAALEALLERCTVCPRDCLNNRLQNDIAACYSGGLPIVSSYTPHFGEEPALVGKGGAGNI